MYDLHTHKSGHGLRLISNFDGIKSLFALLSLHKMSNKHNSNVMIDSYKKRKNVAINIKVDDIK